MSRLLIVVDFQNDFVSGALGFPGASDLHDLICEKIEEYQRAGETVVFTKDTHLPEYLDTQEGKNLPVEHCISGTNGHALFGRVQELSADCRVFEKNTFGSDLLFDFIRQSDFDLIELVGLVSNICVLSNAVLAKTALPEAQIVVDAKCTDSFDKVLHEKALDILEGIQVKVIHR